VAERHRHKGALVEAMGAQMKSNGRTAYAVLRSGEESGRDGAGPLDHETDAVELALGLEELIVRLADEGVAGVDVAWGRCSLHCGARRAVLMVWRARTFARGSSRHCSWGSPRWEECGKVGESRLYLHPSPGPPFVDARPH
jgi:hypothetical protein